MDVSKIKTDAKFRDDHDLEQTITRLINSMKHGIENGGFLEGDNASYMERFLILKKTVQGFIDDKIAKKKPVLKKDKVRMELFDIILTILDSKLLSKGIVAKVYQEIKDLRKQYQASINQKIEELKISNAKNQELIRDLHDLKGFIEIIDIQLKNGTVVLNSELVKKLKKSQLQIIKRIKDLQDQCQQNEQEINTLEESKQEIEPLQESEGDLEEDPIKEKEMLKIKQMQLDLKNKELEFNKKEIELQNDLIQSQRELREFEYFFKLANVILIQSTGKTKNSYNELKSSKKWTYLNLDH